MHPDTLFGPEECDPLSLGAIRGSGTGDADLAGLAPGRLNSASGSTRRLSLPT